MNVNFKVATSQFAITTIQISLLLVLTFVAPILHAVEKVNGVRIWPSPDSTRVVLDLSGATEYSYFTLTKPDRLVIDLPKTKLSTSLEGLAKDANLLNKIRKSSPKERGATRLVFDLNKKIEPMLFALPPAGPYGHRLVIDLFDKVSKVANTKRPFKDDRDIVIAVDAGHGGEDPGSIGGKGTYEKHVTLKIAKKIVDLINKEKGLKAVLTRTGDYYIDLHQRTEKAREAYADLLLSVHADAFTSPGPSGASVWVLSNSRATTEIGRLLEQKEKHSQLLGGAADVITNANSERYLVRTLLDMSMDHSIDQGFTAAHSVLDELRHITKLHQSRPQSANLGVLKSPDIPSILVETGFISNPKEEKLLNNTWQQNRLANSIVKAIKKYFRKHSPDGTYYANHYRTFEHKVKPGESLSLVAQNYKVSVSAIKDANKLKSNTIRVGQVLSIPQS